MAQRAGIIHAFIRLPPNRSLLIFSSMAGVLPASLIILYSEHEGFPFTDLASFNVGKMSRQLDSESKLSLELL
jgi:hypothetical protein